MLTFDLIVRGFFSGKVHGHFKHRCKTRTTSTSSRHRNITVDLATTLLPPLSAHEIYSLRVVFYCVQELQVLGLVSSSSCK